MNPMVKVIQPSGILDSTSGNRLRREIGDLVEAGTKTVLIDCRNVELMDSSGLSALVMALKTLREADGRFALCSTNDQVRMVLELTGMDEVFEIFPNQDEFNRAALATS
jgi:anti-sigma B factor antagonist